MSKYRWPIIRVKRSISVSFWWNWLLMSKISTWNFSSNDQLRTVSFYMEISVHILPISWTSFVFLRTPSFSLSRYSQGGYMSEVRPPAPALSENNGLGLTFHLWATVQTLYRECTTRPRLALRGTSATFHQLLCNATFSSKSKVC